MTKLVFHHDPRKLPPYNESCHPVQIYDKYKWNSLSSSCIARPIIERIRDLGCRISNDSFDFLTIAMSVTAADTFIRREDADNSWSRVLELQIPLYSHDKWYEVSRDLEKALGYLTGDIWILNFVPGGLSSPVPKISKKAIQKKNSLKGLDCVSLFSGGLDSAVGAIDLINSGAARPLLISHSYKGDASKQQQVVNVLAEGSYARLALNADPHIISCLNGRTDITMRGRSFNFIAMAIIGLSAIQKLNGTNITRIIIPENGFISLNPPLTRRRFGSLSTRTTHPHFISYIQDILNRLEFNVILENPYQLKTKGEMLIECKDPKALNKAIPLTVSCSNWHRKGIQCGRCVPCIIRRAAISASGFSVDSGYEVEKLQNALNDGVAKDDLLALMAAIIRLSKSNDVSKWVRESGPLPHDETLRHELYGVLSRGLAEVGEFLKVENIL